MLGIKKEGRKGVTGINKGGTGINRTTGSCFTCHIEMSKNSSQAPDHHTLQPSILGFVDSPNYNTGKGRVPRLLIKTKLHSALQRGSSSNSVSRKRKFSSVEPELEEPYNTDKNKKMETNETPEENGLPSDDPFTKALKKMAKKLTTSLTLKMKEMLDPLQTSINSLVANQKESKQQRRPQESISGAFNQFKTDLLKDEPINVLIERFMLVKGPMALLRLKSTMRD